MSKSQTNIKDITSYLIDGIVPVDGLVLSTDDDIDNDDNDNKHDLWGEVKIMIQRCAMKWIFHTWLSLVQLFPRIMSTVIN